MSEVNSEDFASLVEAARMAPSADNRRVFRLQYTKCHVRIWGDEIFVSGPRQRKILGLIAIGAAVENMRLRAMTLGFLSHVRWYPDNSQPQLIAEIDYEREVAAIADPLEAAIADRHTNRSMHYSGPGLSRTQMEMLTADVASVEGIALHWFDSPEQRPQILRLVRIAETDRFRLRELHEELFSAVRFDIGWKASAEDGLPPGSLEIEPWMRPMFGWLRHWSVVRRLQKVGIHHALGMRAGYLPCRLAPNVGALTTSLGTKAGPLAAGVAFQRLWLRTTAIGMSLQPLAGSALLALPDSEWVSPNVRSRLVEGWRELAPGRLPMMVFRIGHARAPSIRTQRNPLQDFCYEPTAQ